ncbi:hypothetical protein SAMN05192588_2019 [Nonlabens sp. Hel1_33_55]|nr:hypothetical protein SAMN05192588_2019 [Nonlabens sp. Hel1_33_55]
MISLFMTEVNSILISHNYLKRPYFNSDVNPIDLEMRLNSVKSIRKHVIDYP